MSETPEREMGVLALGHLSPKKLFPRKLFHHLSPVHPSATSVGSKKLVRFCVIARMTNQQSLMGDSTLHEGILDGIYCCICLRCLEWFSFISSNSTNCALFSCV
jgi:hypothetical protein